MNSCRLPTISCWLIIAGLTTASPADELGDRLIDGIVSRATAIHNLQVNYTYELKQVRPESQELLTQLQLGLAVEGTNWVVRHADTPHFRMNRNSATVTYYEATSAKGGVTSRALHIEAPETLQDLIGENACYAGSRLGTFWFPQQIAFVDRDREQMTVRGRRTIGNIDTVELEWPVSATDLDEAMIVIPNAIAQARRGRLRVCVAPELGHALPCIEYVTDEGQVAQSFVSSEFLQLGGQIFFPQQSTCTTETDSGQQLSTFRIHRITHVNEALPPQVFSMKVPKGTRVRDARPGVPVSVFYLEDSSQFEQLNQVLAPETSVFHNRSRILLLALNIVCLIISLTVYVVHRCLHPSDH